MMTRQEQFDKFDREHPEFWNEFSYRAYIMMEKGRKHYSARTIFEVLRWHSDLDSRGRLLRNPYKVQNNWIPFYAKKFNEVYDTDFFFTKNRG